MVTLKLRVITHIYEIKNVKISKTKHGKYKKYLLACTLMCIFDRELAEWFKAISLKLI